MRKSQNFDYPVPFQGKMAKQTLAHAEQDAKALRQALVDNDRLPAWVQSYIATAGDRLSTVSRYMQYTIQEKNPAGAALGNVDDELDLGPEAKLAQPVRLLGGFVVGPLVMHASGKIDPAEGTLRSLTFLTGACISIWSLWSYTMVAATKKGKTNPYPGSADELYEELNQQPVTFR